MYILRQTQKKENQRVYLTYKWDSYQMCNPNQSLRPLIVRYLQTLQLISQEKYTHRHHFR